MTDHAELIERLEEPVWETSHHGEIVLVTDVVRPDMRAAANALCSLAAENERLRADLDTYMKIANDEAAENERLRSTAGKVFKEHGGLHDKIQFFRTTAKYNREQAKAAEAENERLHGLLVEYQDHAQPYWQSRAEAAEAEAAKLREVLRKARPYAERYVKDQYFDPKNNTILAEIDDALKETNNAT